MSPKLKKIIIATILISYGFVFCPLVMFASSSNIVAEDLASDIAFQRQQIESWISIHPDLNNMSSWNLWNKIRIKILMNEGERKLYSQTYQFAVEFYNLSLESLDTTKKLFQHSDYPEAKKHLVLSINRLLYAGIMYDAAHQIWYKEITTAQQTLYHICKTSGTVAGKSFGGALGNPVISVVMELEIKAICNDAFGGTIKTTLWDTVKMLTTELIQAISKPISIMVKIIDELPLMSKVIAPTTQEQKTPADISSDFSRQETSILNNFAPSQQNKNIISQPQTSISTQTSNNKETVPASSPVPIDQSEQIELMSIPQSLSVPPTFPSRFAVIAILPTEIKLTWENDSTASGTRIERKIGSQGSFETPFFAELSSSVTSYIDKGLVLNTEYCYRVYALNSQGMRSDSYSDEVCAWTSAPSPISCTSNWSCAAWSTCTNNQQVRTCMDVNKCVASTNEPALTQSCITQSQPQHPTAPSDCLATALSSSRISLVWQDNANNETGFKIERKSSGGTYAQINMNGILSGTGSGGYYEDSGLSAGTNYCYRVRAYNSVGDSDYSDEACASTQAAPVVQPTTTTGSATAITSNSATLNATVNPNGMATGAFFQWGISSSFGNTTPSQIIGSGSVGINISANLTGLTPATVYYFRAVAANGSGGTIFGAIQTFTASSVPTIPVSQPQITGISPNPVPAINASQWVTVNGAGFISGLKIILRTGNEVYTIPITSAGWVNSTQVKIYPNFTAQPAQWTVQAVNPDNQQSNMFSFSIIAPVVDPILSLYPTSGVKGTLFTFEGSGFTPDGGITEVIFKPDGTNYPSLHYSADGNGSFTKTYNSATASIMGTYTITWFDDATGYQSNQVRETINAY